jgi:hypothetical protein
MGILAPGLEHGLVAGGVGAEPALGEHVLAVVDDLDRRRSFVRIHADDDSSHAVLLDPTEPMPARRAALLRAGQTPLEPLRATVTGGAHAR